MEKLQFNILNGLYIVVVNGGEFIEKQTEFDENETFSELAQRLELVINTTSTKFELQPVTGICFFYKDFCCKKKNNTGMLQKNTKII